MDTTDVSQACRRIPSKIRKQRLLIDSDPISTAIASQNDPMMMSLAKIWYTFIEPNAVRNYGCGICMSNILQNFKEFKPMLVQLQEEEEMLDQM